MYICRNKLKFCCFNNGHVSTVSSCFTHCFIFSSVTTFLGCFLFMLSYCQNTFTSVSVSVWVEVIMVLNIGGIYVMLMLSEIIEFSIIKCQSPLCIEFRILPLLLCACIWCVHSHTCDLFMSF